YDMNKELKEREEYIEQLILNAPEAVFVIDSESRIILWNPQAEEIFGWKSEEISGMPFPGTLIAPQYHDYHLMDTAHLLPGDESILNKPLEVIAIKKNGHRIHISLTLSRSSQKKYPVFIAFARDISNEKKL